MTNETTDDRGVFLSEHIVRLAELSFRAELDRYDSLTSSSGRLLTCVSISLVALTALLPFVADLFAQHSMVLSIEAFFILAFVIGSFVCALIAQFRFKYIEPKSPADLLSHILSEESEFHSRLDAAKQYARVLEEPYQSLMSRNRRISFLLRMSTVLLVIAVGLLVLCALVDVVTLMESSATGWAF